MRPHTPHRSPRQAFGGNDNNQLLKLHHNDKNNLARNPLDKNPHSSGDVPIAGRPSAVRTRPLCAHERTPTIG